MQGLWIPEELMTVILLYLPVKSLKRFKLVSKSFNSVISYNNELIMEILSRLPVKSLMRFKLVSKSFNSLISDNHFTKLHLRCSAPNANPPIIFCPPSSVNYFRSMHVKSFLKTPPSRDDVHFLSSNWKGPYLPLGSCNGLMCAIGFATDHYSKFHHDQQQLFWVSFWNPATRSISRNWFTFPITREDIKSYLHVTCGFGYDHVSDTYKVMMVLDKNHRAPVIVFNKGGCNWRHVGYFPPDFAMLKSLPKLGVHFNGTLNWLVNRKIYDNDIKLSWYGRVWDNGSCPNILSFDLNKEVFVTLWLPTMHHKFCQPHIGVLGECLSLSVHDVATESFELWQMNEFGVKGSWTKLLNITREDPPPPKFPLYMFDNGDLLMLPGVLIYRRKDNRAEEVYLDFGLFQCCGIICYESLISPY